MALAYTDAALSVSSGYTDPALIFSQGRRHSVVMALTPMAKARKAAGMTQAQAAERLGVSQPAYARWETGAREPSNDNLRALAALYAVSIDELLGDAEAADASAAPSGQDFLADVEAVTLALLLRLGRKVGEAEALSRVARRAVEALQGRPSTAAERPGRAQVAIDALWTEFRQ